MESKADEPDEDDRADTFIQLLAQHERRLTAYVITLVPRSVDADDVLQETKLALWRSFEKDAELREARSERLTSCIAKLSPNHRQILSLRYEEELQVDELADRINRTITATYRVLSRIRLVLRDCALEFSDDVRPASESSL